MAEKNFTMLVEEGRVEAEKQYNDTIAEQRGIAERTYQETVDRERANAEKVFLEQVATMLSKWMALLPLKTLVILMSLMTQMTFPSGGDGSCRCGEAVPGGDRGGEGGQIYIYLYYILNNDYDIGRTERRCAQT